MGGLFVADQFFLENCGYYGRERWICHKSEIFHWQKIYFERYVKKLLYLVFTWYANEWLGCVQIGVGVSNPAKTHGNYIISSFIPFTITSEKIFLIWFLTNNPSIWGLLFRGDRTYELYECSVLGTLTSWNIVGTVSSLIGVELIKCWNLLIFLFNQFLNSVMPDLLIPIS